MDVMTTQIMSTPISTNQMNITTIQIKSTPRQEVLSNLMTPTPAATKLTGSEFTITTTIGLSRTRVTIETKPSEIIRSTQIIKWPQTNTSSMTFKSLTRQLVNSSNTQAISLTVTKPTDASTFSRTDVSVSSPMGLSKTTIYVTRSETKQLLPSMIPTNILDTNTSGQPGDDHIMLLYPPKNETIKVTVTQNKISTMLNCTVSGPNLTDIDMLWMYNERLLMSNFTALLNGHKVSYKLAELPGVYECIVQSTTDGVVDSRIAGVFEVVMSGKKSL